MQAAHPEGLTFRGRGCISSDTFGSPHNRGYMRIRSNFRGTKGWLSMWERTIRLRHMRKPKEVDRRVKILGFWDMHGTEAAYDAFGTSERTLYRWKEELKAHEGRIDALDPKSTAPKARRRRTVLATGLLNSNV